MRDLRLSVLTLRAALTIGDDCCADLLADVFGAFSADFDGPPDVEMEIRRAAQGGGYVVSVAGRHTPCATRSALVYAIDKELVVAVQRRCPERLFVHAAVLGRRDCALAVVGESGSGKSTLAWGLANRGFAFLSDEVAPIDPATLAVDPYPRALGFKQIPAGRALPASAQVLEATIHVPVRDLTQPGAAGAFRLGSLFFIQFDPRADRPQLERISSAEGAAHLYVSCLNALAHPAAGLDAVAAIAAGVPCYRLTSAGLDETCALVEERLEAA